MRYLDLNDIQHSVPDKVKAGSRFSITIDSRIVSVLIGNSTSTAARRVSEDMLIDQFSKSIFHEM
jgi:hypothetical protein